MPDAAAREDMLPGEAPVLLRCRLFLLRTPLALPLVGVVAALLGGGCWAVVVVAAALAAVLRLWRIMLCLLLCSALAAVHEGTLRHHAERMAEMGAQQDALELEGTVVEMLSRGCLLRLDHPRVTMALRGENLPYAEGDRVRVLAEPREPEPPPVKGMFDRSSWMRSRGIALEADFIRGEHLGHPLSWALLRGCATGIRHRLAERLMPPGTAEDPRRQILCALVLGAQELADPSTLLPFRRGGTLHAFAVSGMHVVMIAGILGALLRLLRVHPATARPLLLVLLAFYVLVTGFSVPAVRALLMLATLLVGLSLRRRVSLANSWCFAALLILLVEPWQLHSAGFLLSFAIYAAICTGAHLCLREAPWFGPDPFIPPRLQTRGERCLLRADYSLRGVIIVSLVAYVVSLPLTAWLFHTITPWSFLTNIAIAPLVPLVMLAGLGLLAFQGIPVLGAAALWLALRAAGMLLALSTWFGYWAGAYLPAESPCAPQTAMVMGTGFGGSVCALGNPGLVIDCGNELTAALQVEPALFHAGYHPAALLLTQATRSHSGGASILQASWPELRVIRAAELSCRPLQLSGAAGQYTIYPPPADLPRRPAENAAPIVLWERADGRRLLYIGQASRATWDVLPAEARRADVLILGRNSGLPLEDPELLRRSGARLVVLLPDAADSPLQEIHVEEPGRLIRLGARQYLTLP